MKIYLRQKESRIIFLCESCLGTVILIVLTAVSEVRAVLITGAGVGKDLGGATPRPDHKVMVKVTLNLSVTSAREIPKPRGEAH